MKRREPTIAKITRPRLSGVFARQRLFRLIDRNRDRPVTWVAAQAGSGKTTLVASYLDNRELPCIWYQVDAGDGDIASFFYYMGVAGVKAAPRHKKPLPLLTPEYLKSIPVFTRRYFEELFRRLKPPAAVVFDNYQDAPQESGFHEMISHALEAIPGGIHVFILSRTNPPAQFARLQANNRLQLIGWDHVRFTREESGELLKAQGEGRADKKTVALLHEKTEGWAAGLVLLLAGASEFDARAKGELAPGMLFDYFANEIFSKTDEATQNVLLKTSFLRRINPSDAEELTGNRHAALMLERLSKNHYFTQKYDRAYQYHPLFREFLLDRATDRLLPDDISRLQRTAAELLERTGRDAEATDLFLDGRDWGRAERLMLAQASTLVSQGRSKTLEDRLRRLPPERLEVSPWALYWLGICRMAFDPYESRGLFEKSFDEFKARNDSTGEFLSWASIVDTFVYAWGDFAPLDRWIAVMEEILAENPEFPSPEIEVRVAGSMLCAIANRQPERADIALWADRVQRIVVASNDVQLQMTLGSQLLFYYMWNGDFSRIALVVDALRPSGSLSQYDPLTRQQWYAWKAMYSWFVADWAECWQAISDGARNAEDSGVHLLDLFLYAQGVFGGLSLGNPDAAVSCLDKMALTNSPRPGDKALYQYQAASVAWFQGDFVKSAEQGKLAVSICESIGWPVSIALCVIELATTLFDAGRFDEADAQLAKAFGICRGMNGLGFHACMHGARFALDRGREKEAVEFLERGMALGARYGFLNLPRWNDGHLSRLCAKALEHNIQTHYVMKLIRTRGLTPQDGLSAPDAWPWPIRITTLGAFEVRKDDKPVPFAGKKKQLELLKVLIALGGNSIREEQVTDILWPDSEGDACHNSFKMALSRLRAMTGNDAIVHDEGLYSLNKKILFADLWDFERLCEAASRLWARNGEPKDRISEASMLTNKAFDLYQGGFLPDDVSCAWTVSMRERLRSKFLRLTLSAGLHYEDKGKWKTAVEYYEKGLEADPLREEFYQRLMRGYHKLGRPAEALAVYDRCRTELAALSIAPSRETMRIYESMK